MKKHNLFDILVELVAVASAGIGFPCILQGVFGRSNVVEWIGAAGGCVVALFTWMAFSRAYKAENEGRD